ncbi:protein takeout isoform X2 [Leptinotarsa decemlineata]
MGKDFSAEFSDIKIYGAENFVLETLDCDVDNLRFGIIAQFPELITTAKYRVKGKIMILQLNSEGYLEGNYTNIRAQFKTKSEFHMKNGKKHLKVHNATTSVEIGHSNIYFDRIFGDNEALNTQVNKLFNDNDGALISELKTLMNALLKELDLGIVDGLYDKYSFDDLFPNP